MNGSDNGRPGLDELEVNYNDRPDGYGFGPPEYMDDKQPYEQERRRIPEVSRDDYGLRNQYGPVDQYSFRDLYERRWSKPVSCPENSDDWREWDREKFENDDYTSYAGPDYKDTRYYPRGYQMSDERIYEEVRETLTRSPDVDATHIGIRIREGIVLLEGWVQGRRARKLAEYLIEDLPGVKKVRNELRVQQE